MFKKATVCSLQFLPLACRRDLTFILHFTPGLRPGSAVCSLQSTVHCCLDFNPRDNDSIWLNKSIKACKNLLNHSRNQKWQLNITFSKHISLHTYRGWSKTTLYISLILRLLVFLHVSGSGMNERIFLQFVPPANVCIWDTF